MRDFPLTALAAGIAVGILTGFITSEYMALGIVFVIILIAVRWVLELIFGTYE